MPDFRALELAIDMATRQRDALARKHAQTLRNLAFGKNQLAQLEGYAADTDARWSLTGSANVSSLDLIRHHYQFMERLQNAMNMQKGVLVNLQGQVDAAHHQLLQAEHKLCAFDKVLQSRRAQYARVQARREQQVTDEFAAMRYTQNSALRQGEAV